MIALALSDWPIARRMVSAGNVACDYFETTGGFTESAVEIYPKGSLLLHNSVGNLSLGHPQALDQADVMRLTHARIGATGTPWFSVHLGFSAAEVVFETWTVPRSPSLEREPLFTTICRNIELLRAAIAVPLIIENLDYNPGGAYEYICEPTFIAAVLEKTGVGLLLDLAHAQVSAAYFNIPIERYLSALPLERVLELHISSPRWRDGRLADAHEVLTDTDYALLEWVLARSQPHAITLEYHRDAAAIDTQLARLRSLSSSSSSSS